MHEHTDESGHTPPTYRAAPQVLQPRSTWPAIIGIVLIATGALSVLGHCIGAIWPLMMDWFVEFAEEEEAAQFQAVLGWRWWMLASSLTFLALGVAQMVAGSGLVARQWWSLPTCIAWAVAKIIVVLISIWPNYAMQIAQMRAIPDDEVSGGFEFFVLVMMVGGVVVTALWGLALPVFALIWFSRSSIRREVAEWRGDRAE
jgi:hypothetical protein